MTLADEKEKTILTSADEKTLELSISEEAARNVYVGAETAPAPRLNRRKVLAAAGSVILLGCIIDARNVLAVSPGQVPDPASRDLQFLTASEKSFVDAAIDRLIPSDALGPGAVEAGVTIFIDHQLAGPYGSAVDWYMQGPWADGTKEQGYQRKRTPSEVYRAAIAAIDDHARRSSNKPFAALAPNDRDALLHDLEDGSLDLGDISAKTFFTLLWENTQQGFFADPIYLGNRNFIGWKLIGYPGPRYNYDAAIRRFGVRYPLPMVGLMGRDPSRQPAGPI